MMEEVTDTVAAGWMRGDSRGGKRCLGFPFLFSMKEMIDVPEALLIIINYYYYSLFFILNQTNLLSLHLKFIKSPL